MSNVNLFNGCKITVEATNKEFHTFDDWGLYITNTNCIGNPEQYTNYVEVPGRDGRLDMSEALTERPTYLGRTLTIELSGARPKISWDSIISAFRNRINGRICKITFDNDLGYFWRGRVSVEDFESVMTLGKFTVKVEAEPYKYSIHQSSDPWLWDPFNFENGIITYQDAWTVTTSLIVGIPAGYMPTVPTFVVSEKAGTLTMVCNGITYTLASGSNRFPGVLVGGDDVVEMTFTGSAKIQIVYRGGSL